MEENEFYKVSTIRFYVNASPSRPSSHTEVWRDDETEMLQKRLSLPESPLIEWHLFNQE